MCPESQTLSIVNPALRFEQISMAKPILLLEKQWQNSVTCLSLVQIRLSSPV